MRFIILLAGTFGAAAIALMLQREIGAPYWAFYVIAVALALLLYSASAMLTQLFISRRVGFDTSDTGRGMQAWELTAGTGVVPKWVSWIGVAAICFGLAVPFELLALLVR